MNHLDQWQALAVVSGAILGVAAVIRLAWKVANGMWKRARKEAADLITTLQATSADFLSVKAEVLAARADVAAMRVEVAQLAETLDEHITWHDQPGGRPAKAVPPQPNGPRPRRS